VIVVGGGKRGGPFGAAPPGGPPAAPAGRAPAGAPEAPPGAPAAVGAWPAGGAVFAVGTGGGNGRATSAVAQVATQCCSPRGWLAAGTAAERTTRTAAASVHALRARCSATIMMAPPDSNDASTTTWPRD
jgi:hypothetical protein